MIKINKQKEPKSWQEYRLKVPVLEYQRSQDLAISLLEEQGYLCGYCMNRISKDPQKTIIEHIKCRSKYTEKQLSYDNMIICCKGKSGNTEHCDNSKKDKDISISPFEINCINTIEYTNQGGISSTDPNYNHDINITLNLNTKTLCNNRRMVHKGLVKELRKKQDKWSKSFIEKKIELYSNKIDGKMTPYLGVILYYLNKKLKTIAHE